MRPLLAPPPAANLVWVGETDSTNDMAARVMAKWVAEDIEEELSDSVLVAATQRAGRGRGSNTWQSPGGGVYATWFGWLATEALTWLPMAAGVALHQSVHAVIPASPVVLKWPNDLVVEGRKLGGILAQSRVAGDRSWAIVGFGVNVEVRPALPDGDPVRPASLRDFGYVGGAREATWLLVGGFLQRFRAVLADPAGTRARWEESSAHRPGELLRVRLDREEVVGRFAGFGPEGQLLLATEGTTRSIAAGEIVVPLPGREV